MNLSSRFLRALSPAIPVSYPSEALRAGIGALVGLGVAGLFFLSPTGDTELGLFLIAPFGASAVLLFAVPNSPLAQPWSAIVGNTMAGIIGVAVCLTVPDPALRIALAVGASITAMVLCRAVHPPAGAVAMTAAMSPDTIAELGFRFVLTPVAAGTIILVIIATLYARLTGRHYPFRHFADPNVNQTSDPAPAERLGLTQSELTDILERYSQSFNIGVEDLARLVGAAELQAATHHTGPMTAADIMSRDLVTISPAETHSEIARLFQTHRFTSLPVVDPNNRFLGIIYQMHLISEGVKVSQSNRGFGKAMARVFDRSRHMQRWAHQIMEVSGPRASPDTPIAALLALMSQGDVDAVPVLENGVIKGMVTQTDMIAALARHSLRAD